MTYVKDPTYWMTNHDWFTGDMDKPREIRLTDKAPERAVESFKRWREFMEETGWDD